MRSQSDAGFYLGAILGVRRLTSGHALRSAREELSWTARGLVKVGLVMAIVGTLTALLGNWLDAGAVLLIGGGVLLVGASLVFGSVLVWTALPAIWLAWRFGLHELVAEAVGAGRRRSRIVLPLTVRLSSAFGPQAVVPWLYIPLACALEGLIFPWHLPTSRGLGVALAGVVAACLAQLLRRNILTVESYTHRFHQASARAMLVFFVLGVALCAWLGSDDAPGPWAWGLGLGLALSALIRVVGYEMVTIENRLRRTVGQDRCYVGLPDPENDHATNVRVVHLQFEGSSRHGRPLRRVSVRSPGPFEAGARTAGASDLAHAILADALGWSPVDDVIVHAFQHQVITHLDPEGAWVLDLVELEDWLRTWDTPDPVLPFDACCPPRLAPDDGPRGFHAELCCVPGVM
jgi:hypothetical protein